jgi:RNA methyltransferase, TrmH family
MITSSQNTKIQQVRALLGRRQAREEAHAFVVEGVRLAEEALAAGCRAMLVLYSNEVSERGRMVVQEFAQRGVEIAEVSPVILNSLSATENGQGLLAVLEDVSLALPARPDFVLIADQVRDPGNLGTLLRTAAAAGVQAVLLAPGTTDAFAPKVLRSGMGAHFRLPLRSLDWTQIRQFCQPALKIYLAEAGEGTACWQLNMRVPLALVVGGEADGASDEARQSVDGLVTIPMPGKSESLNAAIAASILLFEIVRQRFIG